MAAPLGTLPKKGWSTIGPTKDPEPNLRHMKQFRCGTDERKIGAVAHTPAEVVGSTPLLSRGLPLGQDQQTPGKESSFKNEKKQSPISRC